MGIQISQLRDTLSKKTPFDYPLDVQIIPGTTVDEHVLVCCHGYGGNSRLADVLNSYHVTRDHIVSFNFPDYDLLNRDYQPEKSSFGTIKELLPALYVLKQCIIEGGVHEIHLYGFSAGGGVVINLIGVLNADVNDSTLATIGIGLAEKKQILGAIQRGHIILDAPLKSIDEIMAFRGHSPEFKLLSKRYRQNHFTPIEALAKWQGLNLNVLVYFQQSDEILSNRDDKRFIRRLYDFNSQGLNDVVIGDDGGHSDFHAALWRRYPTFLLKIQERAKTNL